jgi:hypothetical protein
MRRHLFAGLIVIVGFGRTAFADGLIYDLPDDGAQARYDLEIDATAGGQQVSTKGSMTISSVGQATIDNEKCRWIEIKMIIKAEDQERLTLAKVLVPEKHLGKGKSPGENLVRGWVKEGDMPAAEIKDLKEPLATPLAAFLASPPKNPGELEKVEIDNAKLGKVSSAGVTGELELDGPGGIQIAINLENRLHEKAPFGLVTANWKFELKANGQIVVQGTFKLTLTEINATALTELPDKN